MDFDVRGRTVLITGAGGGLGRLFAAKAVAGGAAQVVLWDVNQSALDAVAAEVGETARPYRVDLADLDDITAAANRVLDEVGGVDLLVNNAGIVKGAVFWEHDNATDTRLTMLVNTLAPMYVTRLFLDEMLSDRTRPRRILTVASAAALVSNPRMSVYAASKAAALAWSDSLRIELAQAGYHHMGVTTFCPMYIGTGMFAGAGGVLFTPMLRPEAAVEHCWRATMVGQPILIKPWPAVLGRALRGVLPTRVWDAAAGSVFGIYHSMDRFTGRPEVRS